LTYGVEENQLWTQDASITTEATVEFVEFPDGVTADEFGLDGPTLFTIELSGEQRVLFLALTPDVYEAVLDLNFDEGAIAVESGLEEYRQKLTAEDLALSPTILPPVVMTASGQATTDMPGAPSIHQFDGGLEAVLANFGPVFTTELVDEGDTWAIEGDAPLLGSLTGEAQIVDEIETDDGFAFVIDFAADYEDLPAKLSIEELSTANPYGFEALDMILSDLPPGLTSSVDMTASTIRGTITLLPESGLPADLTISSHFAFTVTFEDEMGTTAIDYSIDADASYELTGSRQASSFEAAAVLDQYEPGASYLADIALTPLTYYPIDVPDDEVWTSVATTLGTTPEEAAAGFSALTVIGEDDQRVDVFSLAADGFFRGYPDLAGELVFLWTGSEGRKVTINDATAYRATVDNREWLVWNDGANTFILIGPRDLAEEALGRITDRQGQRYLWQQGDCLDYDAVENLPYAPYGELGLAHCRTNHGFEVVYSEVLPDGPYPDDIVQHLRETCGAAFKDYTGVYPLESALDMIRYMPDTAEWDSGSRYLACLVFLADADGPASTQTRLQNAGPENLVEIEVGTCLSINLPVPCSDPHDAEVLSSGVYDSTSDEPPDYETLVEELGEICDAALETYGPSEGEAEITSSLISDMLFGWDAGIRDYYCVGGAVDEDDFTLAIVGELQGSWKVAPEQFDA